MEHIFGDKVFFNHEIDHNPKPEDAGIIKVYASLLMSETSDPIIDFPTVLAFSFHAKEFLDHMASYRWEQLNCLMDDDRFKIMQVYYAQCELDKLVCDVLYRTVVLPQNNKNNNTTYRSVDYSTDCAFTFYITFKYIPPPVDYGPTLEDLMIAGDEFMHVPFDESIIDNRFRPASKIVVESLSRKVIKKTKSSSDTCTICLDKFKMGESIMTLPCGHEFDDSCILEWFANNHVCPLCRFELPCEKLDELVFG